jgi:DNA-binding NtrC family response regulator
VVRATAQCGLDLRRLAAPDARAPRARNVLATLVALSSPPEPGDRALALVRELGSRGGTVVAYADNALRWTIGERCQPLVVGARHLLDSAADDFEDQLRRRLAALRDVRAAEAVETERLTAVMRELRMVGESEPMLALVRWIVRVSPLSDLPVLIIGESGTGKELVARAIHQLDPKRQRGPFLAVNCAAISAGLAETEFFGHRRSAFTGADRDRKGLFRAAEGGVLFLDELSELGPDVQAKLLRVLQERRLLGVGEDREVGVDVRIIAASNQDLDQLVARGVFRADLLHRLNVLPTRVAPLRERPADLRPLIEHLLARCRSMVAFATTGVAAEFVEALARLELPGNVRQLENLVWHALLHKSDDSPLCISDLPPEVWRELCATPSGAPVPVPPATGGETDLLRLIDSHGGNLAGVLSACEKLVLQATLDRVHGNQSRAAELLGVTPRCVYNKLRKHHLRDPRATP